MSVGVWPLIRAVSPTVPVATSSAPGWTHELGGVPIVGEAAVACQHEPADVCQFAKSSNGWEALRGSSRAQRLGRYNKRRP
jgi:hypothetical protein